MTSGSTTLQREGFRLGDDTSGFRRELDRYVQERLRLVTGAMAVSTLVLLPATIVTDVLHGRAAVGLQAGLLVVGALLTASLHRLLRRRKLAGRTLRRIDAGLMLFVIAACVAAYDATRHGGNRLLVPMLGLFLVARAVIVPSRPRPTFLLTLPAMAGILAVQLARGEVQALGLGAHPARYYGTILLWDQIFLLLCGGLAAFAARINFALRRSAYEAKRIDRYVLESRLGAGAMGEVWRARHALLRRPTAVKILRPEIAGEQTLQRFEREVQLTSQLGHPNTIAVYDYGQTPEGLFYYAMELLDGADLEKVVEVCHPMSPARTIHLLVQACAALAEAHAAGLVHRDVKPSNLILCRQGLEVDVVKVMDFGLVKEVGADVPTLTGAGEVCGSPHTISPEALRGAVVGPAADLYALGAVGCFLLTGKPIFDADNVPLFVVSHLQAEPIPPSARGVDVPEDLERTLLACLAKEPGDRPASAQELEARLRACEAAGGWSEADAEAWWREHAEALGLPVEPPAPEPAGARERT